MSFLEFVKKGRIYHEKLTGDNDLNIFDIQLTNVYLDKYDEMINETVTFHDITSLTLFKNDDVIESLPNNLKYLYIKSGTLRQLPISAEVASNIEVIHLDFTNLEYFPDISKCNKLREITINHSNLNRFRPDYTLPPSLKVVNLRYNHINDVDFTLFKMNPDIKLNFSYNNLNTETIDNIIMVNPRSDIKMQNRYRFIPITPHNYNNFEIRHMMNIMMNPPVHTPTEVNSNVLKNNTQTVHLSSINKSIVTSYKYILKYIETNNIKVSETDVISEINQEFNKLKLKKLDSYLKTQFEDSNIHTILQIKYSKLLTIVWSIVKTHADSANLIERFYTELNESQEVCFTGRMNRLVNVLVGYIEGVVVSISLKEELQMSIQLLMDKLNKQEITYNQTKEELTKILNQEYDVDTTDPNNIISEEYKQSWLVALNDYKPNAILCKIKQKIKVNEHKERMFHFYFIDYNDKIYDTENDFDKEINPIGEIADKDKLIAKIYAYEFDSIQYDEQLLTFILF